jgi:hypothetical protein
MWRATLRTSLAALLVFQGVVLTGCSPDYTTARLPDDPEQAETTDLPEVKPQMQVRIHLHSGEVIEGEVMKVSSREVLTGRPGNYGYQESVCAVDDIATIEVLKTHQGLNALAIGIGVILIAATLVGMAFGFGLEFSGWE